MNFVGLKNEGEVKVDFFAGRANSRLIQQKEVGRGVAYEQVDLREVSGANPKGVLFDGNEKNGRRKNTEQYCSYYDLWMVMNSFLFYLTGGSHLVMIMLCIFYNGACN